VDVDNGKMDKALENVDKQYALAEKINDVAQMSADLQTKGTILLEMEKYDEAKAAFDKSVKLNEESNLSKEIKDNAKLFHHYNLAKIALGKKDLATAKAEAEQFRSGSEAAKNSFQIKQAHELMGMIAFAEKDYDKAIAELQQANQQNPYDLYRLCQAYEAKGDSAKAKETCAKAATFNPLPQLNFAFIRAKAQKMGALSKA
jgi:tetratricopeptide (TPR) repeat protein